MVRVFAAGTFDGLHPGHVRFLEYAAKYGALFVVIARDSTLEATKGGRNYFSERERLKLISSLKIVKQARLGSKGSWLESVMQVKPGVIVLGHDQPVDSKRLKAELAELGLKVRVVRAPAFKRDRYSNSKLKAVVPEFHKLH